MSMFDNNGKISVIHGTDWWIDCDDLAAMRILCKAHVSGKIELKCVGVNAVMKYSASSVDAFIRAHGINDVPVGLDFDAQPDDKYTKYQKPLSLYPHAVKNNDECMAAFRLYRKTLAEVSGRCIITEVGFPQIIMQLLQSGPDEFSPLNGIELVKQKVERIWMMAGRWDKPNGEEYNLTAYPFASSAGDYICRFCPVPIVFLGFEVGMSVVSATRLSKDDILYAGYSAHGSPGGRYSWDPMLVLAGVTDNLEKAGYKEVKGTASVDPTTGVNNFTPSPDGRHSYLVKILPDSAYTEILDNILC